MYKFLVFIIVFISAYSCNQPGQNTLNKPSQSSTVEINGEQLFKINCSQCHKTNQDFTGPALKGARSRWKDINLLYQFVRNSADVIQKDAYAKGLFEKYNRSPMMPMPFLKDEQIEAILEYCDQ